MSLSSLVQDLSRRGYSNPPGAPLSPLPPRPRLPTRHGETVAGNAGSTGNTDGGERSGSFEEDKFKDREYWNSGMSSADGIFWFPAIRLVKGKNKTSLAFANPET